MSQIYLIAHLKLVILIINIIIITNVHYTSVKLILKEGEPRCVVHTEVSDNKYLPHIIMRNKCSHICKAH